MQLFRIVYYSRENGLNDESIRGIVREARKNNQGQVITGGLIYRDGWFAQILEGGHGVVCDLYHRIANDPRHRDVRLVAAKAIESRSAGGDWLGFHGVTSVSDEACLRYGPSATFEPFRMTEGALTEFLSYIFSTAVHVIDDSRHDNQAA